jgi:hypothetical protein
MRKRGKTAAKGIRWNGLAGERSTALLAAPGRFWYDNVMEMNRQIDVISLDAAHRRAFEDVIGAPLEPNQRLVISVTAPASPRSSQSLADWTGVYDGLTEDQIEAIDRDLRTRADLTRSQP